MSAPPTAGRIVLVQLVADAATEDSRPLAPAIVLGVNTNGAVDVVAFSAHWPLSPARLLRNVPHLDSLRVGGAPPVWFWPPRAGVPDAIGGAEVVRELAKEQAALTRVVAALRERVDTLAGAGDVATVYGLLERRVAELERRLGAGVAS